MSTPPPVPGSEPLEEPAEEPAPQEAEDAAAPQGKQDKGSTEPSRVELFLHDMLSSSWVVTLGAVVLAVLVGAVLVIVTDPDVQSSAGYFFSRPTDLLAAAWDAARSTYLALFQGAIYDTQAESFTRAVRPITETMTIAAPLIFAGLGVGLGFRAGLFNIGAQGQIILGAITATFLGFALHLPPGIHLIVALLGGLIGGAVWAGIAGVLKARTGAHEVIVTIMLNNIAVYLVLWIVSTSVFAGSTPQTSKPIADTAMLPLLLGPSFRLHLGFVLALLAAVGVWWLMERSVLGFRMRAVGENANAARTAGISVATTTVLAMLVSGGLAGLAGSMQVLGTEGRLTTDPAGTIGFDAITVALLGRSRPMGTVFAGLLFGAFAAGGRLMDTRADIPIDLVLVLQSLIVLFIAAPPLVRAIFRLPAPGTRRAAAEVAA